MGLDKTLILDEEDREKKISMPADDKSEPLSNANNETSQKFKTIINDTTFVTAEKTDFLEEDLQKLIDIEKNYMLKDKFSEGGQGIISSGKDIILNRYIAIKSLKSNFYDNKNVISNFIKEARITAQLDHPSIIPIYSINSSEIDEGLHITMKLINGHTLKEITEDTALLMFQYPQKEVQKHIQDILNERLEDFIKVCDAISFAHNKKVLHNDLKPDNIMIGEFHEVYVMDWGIASIYDEKDKDSSESDFNKIAGTPGFIAPEIVVGGKATPESDQYALGMILFELITMKPGMTGSSIKEIFEKTRDGKIEPFTHRFSHCKISNDLIAVCKKATALKPENRYTSVADMAKDIRRYLQNDELVARPDNIPRKVSRIILRHKNLAATFILLLLLSFAAVAIFGLIKQNEAERKVSLGLIQINNAQRESKKRALKMVRIHSAIENNAHSIDRHLFHISHLLSRFAGKTMEVMERDDLCSKKTFYPTSVFRDKSNLPEGTLYSPAYKREINLDLFNYSLAPGLQYSQVENKLMKICTIKNYLLKYLINSDSDKLVFENIAEGRELAVEKGFPLKWIYIAFDDGLMVSYPASGGLPESYDPRERQWYKDAKNTRRQKWSKPYFDVSGLGIIISASKSLYDKKGNFYGIASVDMTFDYITNTLMSGKSDNPSVMTRYLIDGEGNVILYNHLQQQQIKEAEENASQIKFKPFPFPEIKSHIKEKKSGQFEVESNGKNILIGYAPVQTLGWYYVEAVNLDQYMAY